MAGALPIISAEGYRLTLIDLIVLSPLGLRAGHGGHHLFDIKRFRQVFECSFFVGADGTVEIRVCRGDNDGQVGLLDLSLESSAMPSMPGMRISLTTTNGSSSVSASSTSSLSQRRGS